MTVYLIDKDYYVLKECEKIFAGAAPKVTLRLFTGTSALFAAYQEQKPDVVFIEKEAFNSEALFRKIRADALPPAVVWVTESQSATAEMVADGVFAILQKPLSEYKIKELLFKIKHPFVTRLAERRQDRMKKEDGR